ncbi:MAG: ABC transporter ATP-binding protein [candidate division WOR-3 bacterium]
MPEAVVVERLSRNYGAVQALAEVSFGIRQGEIFGLIGPNGSGKTTCLRIIATLLRPTAGSVTVFGLNVVRRATEVRRLISYLPEDAGAYRQLSGIEYLRFMATFYSRDSDERDRLVETGRQISDLGSRLSDKVATYSKGMTRRLLLARALMTAPRLAILDEPTSGLDVTSSLELREIIKRYARTGTTILLSSHNMLEVEFLSDRVALLRQGRLIETGTPSELRQRHNASNLEDVFLKVSPPTHTRR